MRRPVREQGRSPLERPPLDDTLYSRPSTDERLEELQFVWTAFLRRVYPVQYAFEYFDKTNTRKWGPKG